jgi:hypothetical protein
LGAYSGAVTQGVGDPIPLSGSTVTYMANNIVLSSSPSGGYQNWTTAQIANLLIHELGHVFNQTVGLGGSAVVYERNDQFFSALFSSWQEGALTLRDPRARSHQHVVGVCDLFSDIQKYRNKIVTVRGVYYYGLRESGCARPLETEGLRWPTALFLIDAGDHKDGERAVDVVTDEPSLRYLDETTAKLMPDIKAKRKHIVAVRLLGLAHAPLGFPRIGELRLVSGSLHLIYQPVVVAAGFNRNRRSRRQLFEKLPVALAIVFHSLGFAGAASFVNRNEHRMLFVGITSNKLSHAM